MATALGRNGPSTARFTQPWICGSCRRLSTSPSSLAGHSHWAGIKHAKGRNDAAKSKEWQAISQEIIQASKLYGPDPKDNPRLALAIANGKRSAMAKATMESAIAKGQGVSTSGAPLEPLTIEAMLPSSVAAVIECLTDMRARALQDVRHLVKKAGGIATPTSYLFDKKGKVIFEGQPGLNADDYLEQAIEAGATDVDAEKDGRLVIFTEQTETKKVADTLSETSGLKIASLDIIWVPNKDNMVTLASDDAVKELEDVLLAIREDPSVQDIYVNCTQLVDKMH